MAKITINDAIISDIDLMIFDKDGTIIDLHQYWYSMLFYRSEFICENLNLAEEDIYGLMDAMGIDVEGRRIKVTGPVGLRKREIVMLTAVDYLNSKGFPDEVDLCREAFAQADKASISLLEDIVKPIDGLFQLFISLKNESCKIAIATSDISERTWLVIEYLGLKDKIDLVVGSDMVEIEKPHPEAIELILSKLAISPINSLIVGDTEADIKMGMNAGLRGAIGVASGVTSRESLLKFTNYVVPNISNLKVGVQT